MKDFIRLTGVSHEGRKLVYRFESSLALFDRKEFYILYERDFPTPPAGILAVPFAAVMVSFCWILGADLQMDVLDEEYAKALGAAEKYFKKWFSKKWPFTGSMNIGRTEKNTGSALRNGLLFSGGLDALTTYLRHKEEKPMLFSFFGGDIPLDQTKLVEACKKSFQEFADHEGLELCRIESDLWTLFDHHKLDKWTMNWWGDASHAMVLSASTAPYSWKYLRRLYIASSYPAGELFGWGSSVELDAQMRWGSTQLEQDFAMTTRFTKIQYFKNFPEYHRFLRVCFTWWKWTGDKMNCSSCEKCYRTMCHLLLNGMDPATCNFAIDDETFATVRRSIEKPHSYYTFFVAALQFWVEIRNKAREGKGLNKYHFHEFLDWLISYKRMETLKDTPMGRVDFALRKMRWNMMHRLKK